MKKRLLGMLMLTFLIGGGSLFTLAEDITVVSKDFPLGTNVVGKWDKDKQTLTMTGQGKIEKLKWQSLVLELGLKNQGTEEVKINF